MTVIFAMPISLATGMVYQIAGLCHEAVTGSGAGLGRDPRMLRLRIGHGSRTRVAYFREKEESRRASGLPASSGADDVRA
jgi:hypothetical protein